MHIFFLKNYIFTTSIQSTEPTNLFEGQFCPQISLLHILFNLFPFSNLEMIELKKTLQKREKYEYILVMKKNRQKKELERTGHLRKSRCTKKKNQI
jgi:hypothetical protein